MHYYTEISQQSVLKTFKMNAKNRQIMEILLDKRISIINIFIKISNILGLCIHYKNLKKAKNKYLTSTF